MTQKQAQTIEQALARAKAENIHVIGTGTMKATHQHFWLVSSQDYALSNRVYIVRQLSDHLACNCQAQGICKHRAVVHQALKDERCAGLHPDALAEQQAEAERLAQLPRELANVEQSEESKLEQLDERRVHTYCVECGHYMLYLFPAQVGEQHHCSECHKLVSMEDEQQHLERIERQRIEREQRIMALQAEMQANEPEQRPEDSPTFTGETDDAGNPLFSDDDAPEYQGDDEPEPDLVAILAEPDLPRSALYFANDKPRQPSMAKRAAAACIVNHTPDTFSIWKA